MKIILHPHKQESKKHKNLKDEIKTILQNNKFNKKIKSPITIVIGGTSTVLEALENGIEPYHIFEDDLTTYSTKIWPSIKITKIQENCFQYQLKKKNNCINFKFHKKNLNFFN